MNTHFHKLSEKTKRVITLVLIVVLGVSAASAGLLITPGSGITGAGPDGAVTYQSGVGLTAFPVDQLLDLRTNGITAPTIPGIVAAGVDALTYTGHNALTLTGVGGLTIGQGMGITITGDGLTINSGGNSYQVDSVLIHQANGITATGVDALRLIGADGITAPGGANRNVGHADGLSASGIDGIAISGASGILATGTDGQTFPIAPNGVTLGGNGVGLTAFPVDNLSINNFQGLTAFPVDNGGQTLPPGLHSLDPELAILLERVTDDSNVNAAVVYHQAVTDSDIATLRQIGVLLGQRYHVLPVVSLTATKRQILQISQLPTVRAIYSNRTLKIVSEPGNGLTGTERVKTDAELTADNGGQTVNGRNVTVAVLDTGLDGTHGDLSGRVVRNVKMVGVAGLGVNFTYPTTVEGLPNTDLVSGHGTFVGGVIAGNGALSGGRYTGVAPGAKLVGLSTGDLSLLSVIEGFDYILWKQQELGIKVVNCSFSADTLYDPDDPVQVATRMLTDRGVSVVFSAGNNGPGSDTLNPYAMAPWVISVGATDERGRLADFSSRGSFAKMNGPSLVAPGVNVVSLRATSVGVEGLLALGLLGDLSRLSLTDQLSYTVGSGTSFSAPQVTGTIALMLDVNPSLTPAQIKDILQRTATPLLNYYSYEVGAGMLNAYAAVLDAAFPQRHMGIFRASLDQGQARYVNDPPRMFTGTVPLGLLGLLGSYTANINIPQNTLTAAVQVAWGPETSINDLSMQLTDPNGVARSVVNTLNLPVLTGRHERDVVRNPTPGMWRVKLTHTLIGTPQDFTGTLETTHAEYPALTDLGGLTMAQQVETYQNLRSFVMSTRGSRFRPQFTISRSDLASALVVGGRVPQYLAGQPSFTDVIDKPTRTMVESVQAAPGGPLFTDASPGGPFRPDDRAARLTAAIALVRAAGLRSQAESLAGTSLPVSDAYMIPSSLRGYVKVALDRGLMTADGGVFRPNDAMKRVELAHAMSGIARLAM